MSNPTKTNAVSTAGVLISLGIIYGDIGTSPLYVMKAILGDAPISKVLVYGGISCVFWTLMLQTTIKYVWLTLQADNKGEGGILTLFTLIRRRAPWLIVPAMIGAAALLADGIITPPISVSSAIEGLRILNPDIPTVPIVITILTLIFLMQSFGTEIVGKTFGPVMLVWFTMLGSLGVLSVAAHPEILQAVNPYYAYDLLVNYPEGFWVLGAVFLCTTGAESLYSDMGHCGRPNIRLSWGFVKLCLLLNYFGQGAWLMTKEGSILRENPFYGIMPSWFLMIGIAIATIAAIIACQALITGSFTLISEAIRLNLWPRVKLVYPTNQKGQLYVPSINWLLWLGCVGAVLYFRESEHMEAAYGMAITMSMLSTTTLMSYYLFTRYKSWVAVSLFLLVYLSIESSFLVANLSKFTQGGWVSLVIATLLLTVMYIWIKAFNIKRSLTEYVRLKDFLPALKELSADDTIPKYTTHLVFMTSAPKPRDVESKVIYSIFQKRPKRADIYWFVHVETTDEPYTTEYKVKKLDAGDVIRIDFKLGFRVEQRINLFFRKVVEELVANGEVDITSRYDSLSKQNVIGDFRFVVLEKFLSYENDLPFLNRVIMEWYFNIKKYTSSESKWFGLDTSSVKVEKVPLVIRPVELPQLKRVMA
ncbi:KUP/HAK/KT family potassium transporter [Pontibacter sp. H259]|uniref:KUP/HAK/KT family potassium transporter n=1 Tax=Pontibacter sp. H259 TaxID=3133421 RepID=UPI0030C5BC53